MSKIEFIASTLFGVEAITAREVKELGYKDVTVENGKVTFVGDEMALCRSNLWIRTAERIYVKIGEFTATTFEELFEGTKALHWEDWIPEDGRFPVEGYSIKSKLFSVSDCQAIVKKAVVERLKKKYKKEWFEENGATYKIKFSLMKDKVTLMIDTSGDGLHKRGYRVISNEAPLRETLAAAMIMLSFWKPDRPLIDPFCGSGTIPIEAAMIGINLAPGLKRQFVSEKWWRISNKLWKEAREEAVGAIKKDITLNIKRYDIDENAIKLSKDNARKAGVEKYITFENISLKDLKTDDKYGVIICNPPYGERMGKLKEVEKLYKEMGKVFKKLDTWSFYILTSHEKFEKLFGREASKKRKLYNGMLKAYYYQYYGPKPEN